MLIPLLPFAGLGEIAKVVKLAIECVCHVKPQRVAFLARINNLTSALKRAPNPPELIGPENFAKEDGHLMSMSECKFRYNLSGSGARVGEEEEELSRRG